MQVILLDKVGKLGDLGDVVKVKEGYARNFLIPSKLARRATEAAIKEFEGRRADLEKAAAAKLAAAQALGEQMTGKTVRIAQKAGVDGRLFGSVTNADVAEALGKMGLTVQKSQVRMPIHCPQGPALPALVVGTAAAAFPSPADTDFAPSFVHRRGPRPAA